MNETDKSDNLLINKVIGKESIAKNLIEELLNIRIKAICKIQVKNGITFELLVEGEEIKYYIEIEKVSNEKELGRRFRYYQDIVDFKIGECYEEYRKSYIIFLCEFDYFKKGFPMYTFENRAVENTEITLGDETYKIILNMDYTKENKKMVSNDIAEFLMYIKTGRIEENYCNLVKNIQEEFEKVKSDNEVSY